MVRNQLGYSCYCRSGLVTERNMKQANSGKRVGPAVEGEVQVTVREVNHFHQMLRTYALVFIIFNIYFSMLS